jgi:hypothetical protein
MCISCITGLYDDLGLITLPDVRVGLSTGPVHTFSGKDHASWLLVVQMKAHTFSCYFENNADFSKEMI